MCFDERLVEEVPEGVGDLLARATDVCAYRRRLGDHLVLEAGVELHVTRLVDLLGGQERRLLLGRVGADQTGELRRDPLLGDHQRGQREEDDVPLRAGHRPPLLPIGGEVDVERRPLLLLPAPVERLRIVELDLRLGHGLSRRRGRACGRDDRGARALVDGVRLADLDVLKPGLGQNTLELLSGERTGDAPRPLLHVRRGSPRPCRARRSRRSPQSAHRARGPARPRRSPCPCQRRG